MPFDSDDPTYLNRRLCSVEIFSPSQVEHPDGTFELLASAWFGTTRDDIPTASGVRPITVGLHSATLTIETCDNSSMERTVRYRSSPLTLTYKILSDEMSRNAHSGSFVANFSAPLLKVLKLVGEGKAIAEKSASSTATRHQDTTFDVFEVDSAGPSDWKIEAMNPARPLPHLAGAELRDVALCTIKTPKIQASITAKISISAVDLWLDTSEGQGIAPLEDEANQNAVLAALVTKAAEKKCPNIFQEDPEENALVVAQSILHRRKPEDAS